jgi:mono/diheme cytochrome c family protein
MSCHGENAEGNGPAATVLTPKPANLKKMSGTHSDGEFAWKIENGRGPMPAWKNILSENQIWDIVNYIQSLSGPSMIQHDDKH